MQVARDAGATTILMVGTAAVRDAPNRAALLERIERETGIACRVIDGETEASLTFLGATSRTFTRRYARGRGHRRRQHGADHRGGRRDPRARLRADRFRSPDRADNQPRSTDATRTSPPRPSAADEALRSLRPVTATELLLAGGTASALGQLHGAETLDDAALDAALRTLQSAPAADTRPDELGWKSPASA